MENKSRNKFSLDKTKKIHKRFKELRESIKLDNGKFISTRELSKKIGVLHTRISLLEGKSNTTLPSLNDLIAYSKYFSVSVDYLLCLTDIKTKNESLKNICKKTGLSEKALNVIITCKVTRTIDELNFLLSNENDFIELLINIKKFRDQLDEKQKQEKFFEESYEKILSNNDLSDLKDFSEKLNVFKDFDLQEFNSYRKFLEIINK